MSIGELKPGARARVTNVGSSGAVRQRLLDLGLLPNAQIEIARIAANGGPVWVKLRGSHVALRRPEAEAVAVAEL